jgi:HAE1 family hydrophobic/amphiphilic exporter-1
VKTQRKRSVTEVTQALREKVKNIPGVLKTDISTGNPIGRMITGGGGKAVQLEIIGHSFEDTNALAEKIKSIMERIPGTVDVSISREFNSPELNIEVDREKAAVLGLDMATIASTLNIFIEGSSATKYREKGETYDIYVRLEESSRRVIEDIENLPITSNISGKQVKLSNIAKIYETIGPQDIDRKNRERVVNVECNAYRRSAGKIIEDLEQELKKITLPADIIINIGGEAEEQRRPLKI